METLILKSKSRDKLELLERVAREMGVKARRTSSRKTTDEIALMSDGSLDESWNSKEDEAWDRLYKKDESKVFIKK